MHRRNLNTKGP